MPQKLSLKDAGKLFGVSAGAIRARAKKNPADYPVQRDNSGKLWLVIDPQKVSELKVSKPVALQAQGVSMTAEIQSQKVAFDTALAVANARAEAAERARDQAEGERDHWRRMAEALAARPVRRWWPF